MPLDVVPLMMSPGLYVGDEVVGAFVMETEADEGMSVGDDTVSAILGCSVGGRVLGGEDGTDLS